MGEAPVFIGAELDAICHETLRLIGQRIMCDGISIFEISEPPTLLRFAATKTIARDQLKGFKLRVGTGLAGAAAQQNQPLISNDVSTDSRFHSLPDRVFRFTTKSVLCAPLHADDRMLGIVELVNKVNDEPFSTGELEQVSSLVEILSPEWADEATAGLRSTFDRLMIQILEIVEVEGISVLLADEDGVNLSFRHSMTLIKTSLEGARLNVGQGLVGWVAKEAKSIFVEDVEQDRRFFQGVDATSTFSTKSVLAVPVMVNERPRVVIEVVNSRASDSFRRKDLDTLQQIAGRLAARLVDVV
jgi:signal transduction protein with GAF and PtsI domain